MSETELSQLPPVQENQEASQCLTIRQRRNGLGDIFEEVDMSLLMERLNLVKPSNTTPCSPCPEDCEDGTICQSLPVGRGFAESSASNHSPHADVLGLLPWDCDSLEDPKRHTLCDCRRNQMPCQHSGKQAAPQTSHTISVKKFCQRSRNEEEDVMQTVDTCPLKPSFLGLDVQREGSNGNHCDDDDDNDEDHNSNDITSSCPPAFVVSESEVEKGVSGGPAVVEVTDNGHSVKTFRPDVCAKRSLIY